LLHADVRPIRQAEAGNVDRLSGRVLAQMRAPAGPLSAAGESAHMVDPDDAPAEIGLRERLDNLAVELVEFGGEPTAHRHRLVEANLQTADPHPGHPRRSASRSHRARQHA
jgi:hypothetical protein